MQISGYGSLAEYYAELARQKAQTSSSAESTAASLLGKTSESSESGASAFAALFSQGSESPPPPPPSSNGGQDGSSEDLLDYLGNQGMAGGVTQEASEEQSSFFAEMLKSFGSTGNSGSSTAYFQNMIKSAYGV